ncbi:endoplasmic reticulum oxidoreductin-1-like protein isoform X2 [Brevipalpus obovatus]|uniref:endoplasmic reticulum oxidoreductin-1-like protein isoform X2 n=1 Tax=Brevipalpus obovatus TaxID=246614 RepID=UPI003D9F9752
MRVTDVSKGKYNDINMKDKSVTNKNHHHYTVFIGALLICIIAIGIFHFYQLEGENIITTKKHHQSSKDTLEQSSEQLFKPKEPKFISGKNRPTFLDILKQEHLDDFIPLSNDLHKPLLANIETFNNVHLTPRLQSIISMDFFRYVKLNLNRECKLWSNDDRCSLRDCTIQFCDKSSLPPEIFDEEKHDTSADDCTATSRLSEVDRTISNEHVETMNTLFECYEHDQDDGQYIDLLLNPERYTGYKGESAHKIWRSIYEENCFFERQGTPFSMDSMCYEERVFYRAISGLHSSINIHLCSSYLFMDGTFTYNKQEFIKRFEGNNSFIKNLYFLFLLELRALNKADQYLLTKVNWRSSGDQNATREAIRNLLKIVRSFKWHFNESTLFRQEPAVAQEFARHFHNISTNIMDCVGCDKCKLWGKLQIHGLGTAFKILTTHNLDTVYLHRHEIVSLINGLTRLSTSISSLEIFNKMLKT